MISSMVSILRGLAEKYGILGLFFAEIIEEVIVPIPSSAVMMSAGFLFLGGMEISLGAFWILAIKVALPLSLGLTVGSLLVYFLTYFFGRRVIERWGGWLGIRWSEIEKNRSFFENSLTGEALIFLIRAFPIIPSVVINALCGLSRMNLKKYLLLTLSGAYLRGLIMGFIGWQTGSLYFKYASVVDKMEEAVLFTFIILAAAFVIYRVWKRKSVV